jgi:plasmid stabilization system protein ParE
MHGNIRASMLGCAAAMALLACASKGSVSSPDGLSAEARAEEELAAEYRSLIDNAMGQTVCREQAVTGSRLYKREVCVTRAQRDAEHENALELLRAMHERSTGVPQPMSDRSASAPNRP